jgi:hypothetical protein
MTGLIKKGEIKMSNLLTKIKNLFTKPQTTNDSDEYHILSDEEFVQFHNERLAELDPWIVGKAVKVLSELHPLMEETREMYVNDPVHWMSPYHFSTGMAIRNLLRKEVCLDNQLTTNEENQNWDNFYVQLMEVAAGCREYPNGK